MELADWCRAWALLAFFLRSRLQSHPRKALSGRGHPQAMPRAGACPHQLALARGEAAGGTGWAIYLGLALPRAGAGMT